jgi:HEAT repeat protein
MKLKHKTKNIIDIQKEIYEEFENVLSGFKGKLLERIEKLCSSFRKDPGKFIGVKDFLLKMDDPDLIRLRKWNSNAYISCQRISNKLKEPEFFKNPNISLWVERQRNRVRYSGLKGAKEHIFRLRVTYYGNDFLDISHKKELKTASLKKTEIRTEKLREAIYQFLIDIQNKAQKKLISQIPGSFQDEITFKNLYIPIQVTAERLHWDNVENFWGYSESEKELERAYTFKGIEETSLHPISWNEAKKMSKRIIVLADPGMGKTTVLKMEAGTIARQEREKLEKNEITIDEAIFPILLRLSDFSKSEEAIFDDIPKLVKRIYNKIPRQIIDILKKKLETEKCILFLDALDEVPIEDRNKLTDKLKNFIEVYPCKIICTSRIVGYPGFFLDRAKEFEIVPFNQKQIGNYVKKWFESTADTINDKSVSAEGLLHDLQYKPQIRGLAQNPLLLSLICSLYQEKDLELPTRRCIVFQKSLDSMLSKWGKKRKQQSEGRIEAKLSLLEEMAYHFSCKGKEVFTLKELLIFTKEYIQEGKALTDFSNPDSIITEISEDDGILIKLEREGNRYIFLHRTFQEYLTASYLKQIFDKDQDWGINLIRKHYWNFEWHETITLLAGLLTNPIPILEDIRCQDDDIFHNLLILVGRCVAECKELPNPLMTSLIEKIFKFWRNYYSENYIISTIIAIGRIYPYVTKMLSKTLNSENIEFKRTVLKMLGEIGDPQALVALNTSLKDNNDFIRYCAADGLIKAVDSQNVDILIEFSKQKDAFDRTHLLEAFIKIGDTKVVNFLIKLLKDKRLTHRHIFADALGQIRDPRSVGPLIDSLKDKDHYIRKLSAWALGEVGENNAVLPLIQSLENEQYYDLPLYIEALGKLKDLRSVGPLINFLNSDHSQIRWTSAWALGEIGDPIAISPMVEALNYRGDPEQFLNEWIRKPNEIHPVYEALAKIDYFRTLEVLIEFMKHENRVIALIAADALGKLGNKSVVEPLINLLEIKNDYLKTRVASTLGDIGDKKATKPLLNLLFEKDENVQHEAIIALGKIRDINTIESLIEFIKNEINFNRYDVVKILGDFKDKRALTPLTKLLKDKNHLIKIAAVDALSKIGDIKAVKFLIETLRDKNDNVRRSAVKALGIIKDPLAVEPLFKLIKDKSVRREVVKAIGCIGNLESINLLVQLVNDKSYQFRGEVVKALGNIGSKITIQPLMMLLSEKDRFVRENAAIALKNIGTLGILKMLIQSGNIDLYEPHNFSLARSLAMRHFKEEKNEKIDFIPVYPKVIEKYRLDSGGGE